MKCAECRYWNRKESRTTPSKRFNACSKALMWWDSTEWILNDKGEETECYEYDENGRDISREIIPEFKDNKMFTQDASDYKAVLYTEAEFFCAHFENLNV